MATGASLSFLSLLLLAAVASASVEDFCKKVAATDDQIKLDFCIKSFRAAPGSGTADDRALAVIAGKLAVQKAKATLPKITQLLKAAAGKPEKGPLADCKKLYGDAVGDLKTAAAAAGQGRYFDANTYFSSGMDDATTCEDGFADSKVRSPLAADDSELFQLAAIGAQVTDVRRH